MGLAKLVEVMPRIIGLALALGLVGCRESDGPSAAGSSSGGDESESTAAATMGVGSECVPDERRACYSGPLGTEGLGQCRAGEQVCSADGTRWLPCADEVLPAEREDCSTAPDDDCDGSIVCEPELQWSKETLASLRNLAIDSEGNILAASTGGAFEYEGTVLEDVYLIKIDPQGAPVWHHNFIYDGVDSVQDLAVDAEQRTAMVGYYGEELDLGGGPLPFAEVRTGFVAMHDRDGNHLWSRATDYTAVSTVEMGPDGTVYVVGRQDFFDNSFDEMVIVAAYDTEGTLVWEHRMEGVFGLNDRALSLARMTNGELVLAGILSPGDVEDPTYDDEPLELGFYGAYGFRLSADGDLLGYRELPEPDTVPIDSLRAFALSDGTLTVVFTAQNGGLSGGVLGRYSSELETISEQWIGTEASVRAVDIGPDDTIVVALFFFGSLEVSPVGVYAPPNAQNIGIVAVDREGQGRWLELMRDPSSIWLHSLAVGPGGVVAARVASDSPFELAGQTVENHALVRFQP